MRTIAVFITLCVGSTVAIGDEALPAAVQEQLTQATVLVKSSISGTPGQNAGFLVQARHGIGVVVTNARAVQQKGQPARQIECVFHSATTQEYTLPAEVVAVDKARDIAVLQVKRRDLPRPIELEASSEVRPGMTAYACGFAALDASSDQDRSTVEISSGSVGDVRRDAAGNILFIQTNDVVGPGNAGGPVVDSAGRLIGVSVARLKGTSIGLASPVQNLRELMNRKVAQRPGRGETKSLR